MEPRKLTKEDIDKVRNIEGFPIGSDEDIIALSNAPYYTACPNPFIEEFIKDNSKPYVEATDNYKVEPFAADVSASKNDAVYTAHSYHTKVPYKAIMRYILHYTKPGDIVFDGFCGTGMTGVAAQMCDCPDLAFKNVVESEQDGVEWGARYAVLNDLAVAGAHISSNYNLTYEFSDFISTANCIISECQKEYGWLYETKPPKNLNTRLFDENNAVLANMVWSNVVICPNCSKEIVFYNAAVDSKGRVRATIHCPHCEAEITKQHLLFKDEPFFDDILGEVVTQVARVPVFKVIAYNGKKYTEELNSSDYETIDKINRFNLGRIDVPSQKMLFRDGRWGDIYRSGYHKGFTYTHHFYSKRNIIAISILYNHIKQCNNERIRHMLMYALTGAMPMLNRTNRWRPEMHTARGPINGILYIPSFYPEMNVFSAFLAKVNDIKKCHAVFAPKCKFVIQSNQSSNDLRNISDNSIDYIFVDPPFGDNIMYSESNFLWETLLKVYTNSKSEAIVNNTQGKKLVDYQRIMESCFAEFYRILKPNRWMTVEFHNSKNAVWNAIHEALARAGFIIADVRTLDKNQGSFKQITTAAAVKQDLVISAYKPTRKFIREISLKAGTPDTAWQFVHQHLIKLPVVVIKNDRIELNSERQAYLLFDRMVAYHIMQGIPVPLDATDFYRGLDEKFLKRDGMYFLPDQVNEYDTVRIKTEVENVQMDLFVTNEKSAITWLYQQLSEDICGPQTYAELQPKFMQEVKTVDKYEALPELAVLLEENFLKDADDCWYIPDVTKEGDVAKLREKKLWKDFEGYMNSKGKLKSFRLEAIKVGFKRLWKDKNYQAIVDIGNRLPEKIVQEDSNILMYYDISLGRI